LYLEAEAKTAEYISIYKTEDSIHGPTKFRLINKSPISPTIIAVAFLAPNSVHKLIKQLAALM
jgi:hypothetical protein